MEYAYVWEYDIAGNGILGLMCSILGIDGLDFVVGLISKVPLF